MRLLYIESRANLCVGEQEFSLEVFKGLMEATEFLHKAYNFELNTVELGYIMKGTGYFVSL